MTMRHLALAGSVVSLGAVMVGAGLQQGTRPPQPPGQARQPAQPRQPQAQPPRATETAEYGRFGVTSAENGQRVYLWGFNGRTGEAELLGSARADQGRADRNEDGSPPIFRNYYFGSSNDGRRVYVWGFNPGEGRIELVSTADAPQSPFQGEGGGRGRDKDRDRDRDNDR